MLAQSATAAKRSADFVLGAYAGEEPAYRDEEGTMTGPESYAFHFLPNGRAFMDWKSRRTGRFGRTFGVYTTKKSGRETVVVAQFFPSMDSAALDVPATDYFETYRIRFLDRKARAKYLEDSNAPSFLVKRVTGAR